MTSSDSAGKHSIWKDRRVVLSTLWVFLVLNFLYADIFTLFFDPAAQTQTSDLSSGAVFFFAVIMETAMLMVLLSRVLPHGVESLDQRRRRRTAHGGPRVVADRERR